jgi:ABC-type lipoprotein export system ATPase subunit
VVVMMAGYGRSATSGAGLRVVRRPGCGDRGAGRGDRGAAARAAAALQTVGLGDRLRHLPGELSGGQQQRVAIAWALVKRLKVVLADEPTGNLDEGTRDDIMGLLEQLWRDRGMTLVLVTHDSAVARRAQRIGVMQNGKLSIRQDTRGRGGDLTGRAAHQDPAGACP